MQTREKGHPGLKHTYSTWLNTLILQDKLWACKSPHFQKTIATSCLNKTAPATLTYHRTIALFFARHPGWSRAASWPIYWKGILRRGEGFHREHQFSRDHLPSFFCTGDTLVLFSFQQVYFHRGSPRPCSPSLANVASFCFLSWAITSSQVRFGPFRVIF